MDTKTKIEEVLNELHDKYFTDSPYTINQMAESEDFYIKRMDEFLAEVTDAILSLIDSGVIDEIFNPTKTRITIDIKNRANSWYTHPLDFPEEFKNQLRATQRGKLR